MILKEERKQKAVILKDKIYVLANLSIVHPWIRLKKADTLIYVSDESDESAIIVSCHDWPIIQIPYVDFTFEKYDEAMFLEHGVDLNSTDCEWTDSCEASQEEVYNDIKETLCNLAKYLEKM